MSASKLQYRAEARISIIYYDCETSPAAALDYLEQLSYLKEQTREKDSVFEGV